MTIDFSDPKFNGWPRRGTDFLPEAAWSCYVCGVAISVGAPYQACSTPGGSKNVCAECQLSGRLRAGIAARRADLFEEAFDRDTYPSNPTDWLNGYQPLNRDWGLQGYTAGNFADEQASCVALDNVLDKLSCFNIYREVPGYYLQPKLGSELKTPRIDRILTPKQPLIDRGWSYGPIGIECKRSMTRLGRPISQLLDYGRAIWQIRPGYWIQPAWLFLWPLDGVAGPIESILAQHRLGGAWSGRWTALTLHSGQTLARFEWDGTLTIGAGLNGAGRNGRKAGSR